MTDSSSGRTLRFPAPVRRPRMSVAVESVPATGTEASEVLAARVADHYERRGRILFGLARRLGATQEESADVVQEAHLRLWQAMTSGTRIEDLDAWTFRVAYRLVMDRHRIGRRARDLIERLTAPPTAVVTPGLDEALSLWSLVDRLPARERATLYLHYRADLTFVQVGHVMGVTPASARTYASRGMERLRDLIDEVER